MKTQWAVDTSHSEVQFKVKHLMITTVTGSLEQYQLTVETEGDDFTNPASILFKGDVNYLTTNNQQRDDHLKSPDFFDAEHYPDIIFEGTSLANDQLKGNLTIKGVTKPISLSATFGGIVTDGYGQTKAGFEVSGKISRKEFGLTWSAVTEAGTIVVSDDIRIVCEIQLVKQS